MTEADATVFLVDDDESMLRALRRLIGSGGYEVRSFSSPATFLAEHDPAVSGCAVLDVSMPGLDGLQLQEALSTDGARRPVIFLTGAGDIPTSVRAMKAGAIDFLTKPVDRKALLAAIRTAIDADGRQRRVRATATALDARLATLTPREHEVLGLVVAGRLNKQIANDLGASIKTIKVHRARVMGKMGVRTVADLVRLTASVADGNGAAGPGTGAGPSARESDP